MLEDKDLVSIQEVRGKVELAYAAWLKYRAFSQEQVDQVVEGMATASRANARRLAELAVEETGYGNAKDKLTKNLLAAVLLPRRMRGMKTIGVIRELPDSQIVEIAVPAGVVAAILPTTNPTSTAIYKVLISLKAGNAIVLSPHPSARRCTCETASVLERAAVQAGAPVGLVQCIAGPTLEATEALMRHKRTGVILSTGGHGIVKAAYSSGKPAFGVGPGNVPVLIDKSADIPDAVAKVVAGRTFDYGTLCSSEQAVVAETAIRDAIAAELKAQKAFFCDDAQKHLLARLLLAPNGALNPKCVGQAAPKTARMAGFNVPDDTSVLAAHLDGVGREHPLSAEKLSPVLSLYFKKDFAECLDVCEALLRFGGLGHTSVIHSRDDARIREFGLRMPSMRVLVNTSSPQGSTGITTDLFPAMTLGCGALAGNITGDNIGPRHLFNIKRVARAVRKPEEAWGVADEEKPVEVDRKQIADAVERYLGKRGMGPARPRHVAAEVVDRFLAARGAPAPPTPAPVPPVAVPPELVDFVCEDDVRKAIRDNRKIYIRAKTIVTPSARDLGRSGDILVLAER
ncbi:MAG: aldehyde dehydrogenase family protein [Acidobacteriota bacterium]|nr:aldehyde dehydrogenase family protein [Acidobacteriota bacterium]